MENNKEYTCDVCQRNFARDKALVNHKNLAHPQKDAPAKSSTIVASVQKKKELFKPKIKLKKIKLRTVSTEYNPAPYFGFKTLTDMFKKSMKPCVEKMQIPEKLWGIVEDIEEKYRTTCGKSSREKPETKTGSRQTIHASKEEEIDVASEKDSANQISKKLSLDKSDRTEVSANVSVADDASSTVASAVVSVGSDGKGYWCEICSRGFSRLAALEKHKKASHDNKGSSKTISSPSSKSGTMVKKPDNSRKSLSKRSRLERRREQDRMRKRMKRHVKHVARTYSESNRALTNSGVSRESASLNDAYGHEEKRQRKLSCQESGSGLQNSYPQDEMSSSKKESSGAISSQASKPTWRFKYYCDHCFRAFSSPRRLEEHQNGLCPVTVKKKAEKKDSQPEASREDEHPKEKAIKKQNYCDSCGRKFGSLSALKIHKQTHLKDKRFPCEFCGLGFADNKELARHRLDHNYDSEYRCFMCNKLFLEKEEMVQHELLHKSSEDTFCSVKILGPTEALGKPGFLEVLELGSVVEDIIERKRRELENSIGFYRAV